MFSAQAGWSVVSVPFKAVGTFNMKYPEFVLAYIRDIRAMGGGIY
jgi:hypothetical protein